MVRVGYKRQSQTHPRAIKNPLNEKEDNSGKTLLSWIWTSEMVKGLRLLQTLTNLCNRWKNHTKTNIKETENEDKYNMFMKFILLSEQKNFLRS